MLNAAPLENQELKTVGKLSLNFQHFTYVLGLAVVLCGILCIKLIETYFKYVLKTFEGKPPISQRAAQSTLRTGYTAQDAVRTAITRLRSVVLLSKICAMYVIQSVFLDYISS